MAGFAIVEFLSEQTVEVVPTNWVIDKNTCWWPASTGPKLQKLIMDEDSGPDLRKGMGVLYSAKIIKTYENYADAKKQLPEAENTSCLETESDGESLKSRKERKKKQLDDFIVPYQKGFEYEPADSEDDSPSLLSDLKKKKKDQNGNVPYFDIPSSTPKEQEKRPECSFTADDIEVPMSPLSNVGSNVVTRSRDEAGSCSCSMKILDELKKMKEEQSRFQEVILRKVIKLEEDVSEAIRILGRNECSPVSDIPSFPISTFEELEFVEGWLNDENIPTLIQHFAAIGGACTKDTTRRILSRMLKGEICSLINWTGKNRKYPFGKTCLSTTIISSVRLCHPESTEKDIEEIIKAWFRFSKDRSGGRIKRRQNENVTEIA